MKKKLNIRVRKDFDVFKSILNQAKYLDSGASKQAYVKDNVCYKIPVGYKELNSDCFTTFVDYPYTLDDFNHFLDYTVCEYNEAMVWPIGQMVFEIIIWEHLKELETQGYDISGFAAIKDYYIDCNGIPVIEQEYVCPSTKYFDKYVCSADFEDQNKDVLDALEQLGFSLNDIRQGNMAYNENGILKLFDFGISAGSSIYDYNDYDSCYSYNDDYEEEY